MMKSPSILKSDKNSHEEQLASQLHDNLLLTLKAHPHWRLETVVAEMLRVDQSMEIAAQLAQIDQMKAWLDGFRPLPPDVLAELKQRYDVRFTYHSNAIEGNTLTQSETELVLSKGITIGGKTLAEHLEVIGHKEAIDYIETLSQSDSVLSEWEIRQIHSLVVRKNSPAEACRYRQLDVKAAGTNHIYPPHYLLPDLIAEFSQWLVSPPPNLHPIEYATEAHYRFVSIHPFKDGNGRTGRLLMNLLLLKAGFPIVTISNEKRQAYIESLVQAQSSQAQISQTNLTGLLNLVCEAAHESLVETLSVVASAADSRGKGLAFYREMTAFLERQAAFLDFS